MATPTGLLTDEAPSWTILDAARDITDLRRIGSEDDWRPGVNLWWRTAQTNRIPVRSIFTAFTDPDIATIADPAVWPDAPVVFEASPSGDDLASFPVGVKLELPDPGFTMFRPFIVYAPSTHLELYQGSDPDVGQDDANAQAQAHLAASVHAQIVQEFASSLATKNPGLYRTASNQSAASAVDMTVAVATLYEAHGRRPTSAGGSLPDNELTLAGGSGDARLTVPYHAIPGLIRRQLVRWTNNRLIDCYGNPVITAPGYTGRGPLTDGDDLETSQDPAAGEGWFYISHVPYVGIGRFENRVEGPTGRGPQGSFPKANEEVALAEAGAIVVFRPERVFAVRTLINEVT